MTNCFEVVAAAAVVGVSEEPDDVVRKVEIGLAEEATTKKSLVASAIAVVVVVVADVVVDTT